MMVQEGLHLCSCRRWNQIRSSRLYKFDLDAQYKAVSYTDDGYRDMRFKLGK